MYFCACWCRYRYLYEYYTRIREWLHKPYIKKIWSKVAVCLIYRTPYPVFLKLEAVCDICYVRGTGRKDEVFEKSFWIIYDCKDIRQIAHFLTIRCYIFNLIYLCMYFIYFCLFVVEPKDMLQYADYYYFILFF